MAPSNVVVATCLILNIVFSISIVMINKWIYSHHNFPNMTLTCIHFIFTSLGLCVCHLFRVFEVKSLPFWKMVPLSLTFCGFVVFTNLSLEWNTIGTYQLAKSLTTPCIIAIQLYFYSTSFSLKVKLTSIPIIVGVLLNSFYDIFFNMTGTIFALIGVVVTSLYQVWVAEKQSEFQVNALQLLYYQAPLSAVLLAFCIPFFEPVIGVGGLLAPYGLTVWLMVGLSGAVAFLINMTIFWIIGNTSPLTYNMVGHLKFCLTLLGGYVIFQDEINLLQCVGILVTLSGVIMYTHFKMMEQKAKQSEESKAGPDVEKG